MLTKVSASMDPHCGVGYHTRSRGNYSQMHSQGTIVTLASVVIQMYKIIHLAVQQISFDNCLGADPRCLVLILLCSCVVTGYKAIVNKRSQFSAASHQLLTGHSSRFCFLLVYPCKLVGPFSQAPTSIYSGRYSHSPTDVD